MQANKGAVLLLAFRERMLLTGYAGGTELYRETADALQHEKTLQRQVFRYLTIIGSL